MILNNLKQLATDLDQQAPTEVAGLCKVVDEFKAQLSTKRQCQSSLSDYECNFQCSFTLIN